jgi:hypothetical protein
MPTAEAIAEAVWRFVLTNDHGVEGQQHIQARATDLLFGSANEQESIKRQKALTDGLDYIINGAPDSLKAIHADVRGINVTLTPAQIVQLGSQLKVDPTAIIAGVEKVLQDEFDAIPTAAENAKATIAEIAS